MEKFYHKNNLVAIRITSIQKGSIPITQNNQPVQVVTLKHPKGTYLKAHMHQPKKRITSRLQECLIVKKGKIKIDLFGFDKVHFKSVYLKEGQVLILVEGGYGITLVEDSEVIEVKNGPFVEDKVLI